ncbi:DNA polymerase [Nocardia salmonicida]|uniref:DNA polymerase n=1 Tax=Nocardia salmonicida TaxID=53431 RepID=UPI0033DC5C35
MFEGWITRAANRGPVGVDSETTGLAMYSGDTLRTVQFGDAWTGYVLPVEKSARLRALAAHWLRRLPCMVLHNASFDLQFFEEGLGVPAAELWPRVRDTKIIAHLADPRGQEEGGTGHGLEQLTRAHISAVVAEEVKASMGALAREMKTTKSEVWRKVDIDNPAYNLYAGMDPILAVRLYQKLLPRVPNVSRHLINYEHDLARVCTAMERRGFLLDVDYTQGLSERLQQQEDEATMHAAAFFSVESVNSTRDVASAFLDLGVKIPGRTATGEYKIDKVFLDSLVTDDPEIGSPAHLAAAVQEAKKARKWRTTWIDGFLAGADRAGRIHPVINPLRARTARMSITGIPAQTLPSGDWIVRRCFIADPGETVIAVDYKAQELRVLAALSGDPTMQHAFANDLDLHQITADAAGVVRPVGKMANFLTVYGGQADALALQASVPRPTAVRTLKAFGETYPGVIAYSKKRQADARRDGYITTATGRVLPVDRSRAYSALNYDVQSTSRDVTCRGLLALDKAGLTEYLRLPVHDEVVASVPTHQAEEAKRAIAQLMRMELRGVLIDTDAETAGASWGHKYMKG